MIINRVLLPEPPCDPNTLRPTAEGNPCPRLPAFNGEFAVRLDCLSQLKYDVKIHSCTATRKVQQWTPVCVELNDIIHIVIILHTHITICVVNFFENLKNETQTWTGNDTVLA